MHWFYEKNPADLSWKVDAKHRVCLTAKFFVETDSKSPNFQL